MRSRAVRPWFASTTVCPAISSTSRTKPRRSGSSSTTRMRATTTCRSFAGHRRQPKGECAPLAKIRDHGHVPTMQASQLPAHEEAKTDSGWVHIAVTDPPEAGEQPREILGADARAVVRNCHQRPCPITRDGTLDWQLPRRVLERIQNQVADDALQ